MFSKFTLALIFLSINRLSADKFKHFQHLHHDYLLEWNYDNESITLRLTVESSSWIGFGLSPKGQMAGSDIMIGGVNNGKGYLLDTHAKKAGPPIVDEDMDLTLVESSQVDGITSLTIKRKLKTGDQFDRDITKGEMGVIWAYGFADLGKKPEYWNYHWWRRGEGKVNFLTGVDEGNFEYSEILRDKHGVAKDVTLDWFYTDEDITFKYSAPTSGWIGFGFSPGKTMAGADMIIGGIMRDESYYFDSYAKKNGYPRVKEDQNIEILKMNQDDDFTTMIVRRKLKTGDDKDMNIIAGKMNIIWAYGKWDIIGDPWFTEYHGPWNRGSKVVELTTKKTTTTIAPETTTKSSKTTDEPLPPVQPRGTIALDASGEVQFFWSQDEENIIIAITAPTTGWVGVGFSSGPTMTGADLVISGVEGDESGTGYIYDAHGTMNGIPTIDKEKNVTLLMASQNDTSTRIMFERKIAATDSKDYSIPPGDMYVLWAYGEDDFVVKTDEDQYHGSNRGAKKMVLRPDWP